MTPEIFAWLIIYHTDQVVLVFYDYVPLMWRVRSYPLRRMGLYNVLFDGQGPRQRGRVKAPAIGLGRCRCPTRIRRRSPCEKADVRVAAGRRLGIGHVLWVFDVMIINECYRKMHLNDRQYARKPKRRSVSRYSELISHASMSSRCNIINGVIVREQPHAKDLKSPPKTAQRIDEDR